MNINEYVSFCNLYFKHNKYLDFKKYNMEKYSFWNGKIRFITNIYDQKIIRKIFNIMINNNYFKKYKINRSTFYRFDPFDTYKDFREVKEYYINWN